MTDSERGLYCKYRLEKMDGTPVDPDGLYFVLKLNSKDPAHRRACQAACRRYAELIADSIPLLAEDLLKLLEKLEA